MTTVEELGPLAVTFHLRDSVVYEHAEGVAVQWVPLGEGTVDFKALVARAAELMPAERHGSTASPSRPVPPSCCPCTPEEWWGQWFPRARARDLGRFLGLARRGRPYDKPHLTADVADLRDRYMDALKAQQLEHMERSLDYCRTTLDLGVRWRG